jgi:recombination protein RecA
MPAIARAISRDDLESLLRLKKLDHTVTAAEPLNLLTTDGRWLVPTGIAGLDERLQGGLPRGHLSEVVGPRSSGRLAVVLSALAGATRRGEAVAFIDPLDMLDPPSAAASGVDFSRVLWIRGEATSSARVSLSCEYGTLQKSLDRAVKSLNLVLQAGGFGLVVLDLEEMPSQVLRRLPFTIWLRLHRVIEGSETACVLIGAEPLSRSAGGVTVHLGQGQGQAPGSGLRAPGQAVPEAHITARVVRARAMETPDVCLPVSAAAC